MGIVLLILMGLLGVGMLLKGADWLVDASTDFARYLHISPLLVGLTIVSLGTSLPEFIVTLFAALGGTSDIAIGNIVGSNIANIGLVIGVSALIMPLVVRSTTLMYEFPFLLVSSFLLLILANDKNLINRNTFTLNWVDGLIFLAVFLLFMFYIYKTAKLQKDKSRPEFNKEYQHKNSAKKNLSLITAGAILLAFGGKLFVNTLIEFTAVFNISGKFMGLTIAALATSLPEIGRAHV